MSVYEREDDTLYLIHPRRAMYYPVMRHFERPLTVGWKYPARVGMGGFDFENWLAYLAIDGKFSNAEMYLDGQLETQAVPSQCIEGLVSFNFGMYGGESDSRTTWLADEALGKTLKLEVYIQHRNDAAPIGCIELPDITAVSPLNVTGVDDEQMPAGDDDVDMLDDFAHVQAWFHEEHVR